MEGINPVCWFDIYVANLERAKKFYKTVFNLQLIDLPSEWGKQSAFPFENGASHTSGALVEKENYSADENNTIVYFSTIDCVAEQARVEKAGGTIIKPKTSIGDFGFIAIVKDTEGNTIGLHSRQ